MEFYLIAGLARLDLNRDPLVGSHQAQLLKCLAFGTLDGNARLLRKLQQSQDTWIVAVAGQVQPRDPIRTALNEGAYGVNAAYDFGRGHPNQRLRPARRSRRLRWVGRCLRSRPTATGSKSMDRASRSTRSTRTCSGSVRR